MANSFLSSLVASTSLTAGVKNTIYTAPAGTAGTTSATLIGLSIANVVGGSTVVNVDAYITRSGVDYALIKGAPVPPGGTLVVVGGDQKVIMQPNDVLKVLPSVTGIDVMASYLLITP